MGALTLVLEDPPYGPGVDEAKVSPLGHLIPSHPSFNLIPISPGQSRSSRSSDWFTQNLNLQTLVSILNSTKSAEVPSVLRSLSPDAQDTLMKYLYKGMAMPGWGDVSGSVLLGWHEKVRYALPPSRRPLLEIFADERYGWFQLTEIAGTGCIVRVMTDRRTV